MPSIVTITVLLLMLLLGCSAQPTGQQCTPVAGPSCACQPDPNSEKKIDLTPLSNAGTARFTDIGPDPNDYVYDYNPCSTFYSDNGGCQNAFICQTANDDPSQSYQIADAGTEEIWIDTDGSPYAYYTAIDQGTGDTRESFVYLVCDHSLGDGKEQITTDGDSAVTLSYVFHLSSCHVCPGGCGSGGGGGGSGGVAAGIIGIVLIIAIIGGLVTYFIVGAVIMKVKFNANGSDIIPNKAFWVSFPGLLKDGCLFTISPCLKAAGRGRKEGYESVP